MAWGAFEGEGDASGCGAMGPVPAHGGGPDFARAGFLAAGMVARLQVGDFVPAGVDVGDELPLGDLWVVEIEQDFAGRTVDGFAERIGLIAPAQASAIVVRGPIQGLQHQDNFVRFQDGAEPAQEFDRVGKRLLLGEARPAELVPLGIVLVRLIDRPGHDRHPRRADPFRDDDRSGDGPGDFVPSGLVLLDKRGAVKAAVGDKHAHRYAEAMQLGPDFFLHLRRLFLDAVIFPRGEALVGGEAHLVEVGFALLVLKRSRVQAYRSAITSVAWARSLRPRATPAR